jgi:hypothetical protein
MDNHLIELLEEVRDRAAFFAFVRALIRDRDASVAQETADPNSYPYLCPDAGGWYSRSIAGYLETSLAWAEATKMGVTQGLPEEPSWQAFATFLYLGKIYE